MGYIVDGTEFSAHVVLHNIGNLPAENIRVEDRWNSSVFEQQEESVFKSFSRIEPNASVSYNITIKAIAHIDGLGGNRARVTYSFESEKGEREDMAVWSTSIGHRDVLV